MKLKRKTESSYQTNYGDMMFDYLQN